MTRSDIKFYALDIKFYNHYKPEDIYVNPRRDTLMLPYWYWCQVQTTSRTDNSKSLSAVMSFIPNHTNTLS